MYNVKYQRKIRHRYNGFVGKTIEKLCYSEQFYLKDECRTTGNAGLRRFAISQFCRDVNFPIVPNTHLLHCNNPTLNQFIQTESNRSAASTAVKFLSVYSPSGIVGSNDTAWCRMLAIVLSLIDDLVIYPSWEWLHSLFFGFLFNQSLLACIYSFLFIYFGIFNMLYE